jgi:hypothetical protein
MAQGEFSAYCERFQGSSGNLKASLRDFLNSPHGTFCDADLLRCDCVGD